MNSHSIMDLTSPMAHEVLQRSRTAVIPLGSTEQHGPHLPCGTDTMASELVAHEMARQLDALYVPFGPYGVTPIHEGHPGTISLRRETFEAMLTDLFTQLAQLGARTLLPVNWHEGNTPSIDAVSYSIQQDLNVDIVVVQACYVAQRIYRDLGGELTHGGGIETLAVLAHDPDLVQLDNVSEPTRPVGADELDTMRRSHEVYGFVTDVTEIADDGWYGNPWWATAEEAAQFVTKTTDASLAMVEEALKARAISRARVSASSG